MKRQFQFCCPECRALFPVSSSLEQFNCPHCGRRFTVLDLAKGGRGWVVDQRQLAGPAVTQVIHPLRELPRWRRGVQMAAPPVIPRMGAARLRRERRRARRKLPISFGLTFLVLLGLALISPAVVQGRTIQIQEPPAASPETGAHVAMFTAATATPSPIVEPTITPTETSTPTRTATSLPARQVIATAWQATVDQAAYFSHATQTQVVEMFSTTQTSLPPTLTAMAADRDATATQKAFSATETAQSRVKTRP